MEQRSRGVYACFSSHIIQISNNSDFKNRNSEERHLLLTRFNQGWNLTIDTGLFP